MRLTVLFILLTITAILTISTIYHNSFQIDFAATKNNHLTNQRKAEIMGESNVDSLRQRAISAWDSLDQRRKETDLRANKIQVLLVWTLVSIVGSLAMIVVEILKRTRQPT
jgi:hypothetical protein